MAHSFVICFLSRGHFIFFSISEVVFKKWVAHYRYIIHFVWVVAVCVEFFSL